MLGSGVSSLAIWTPFNSVCTATVRTLRAKVLIAWTRNQVVSSFAIVGTSQVGGTDVVKGNEDNVLNNADLYEYFDETDRVLRIEYERNLIEPLGGAAVGMCTIVLDNNDLRFTPNYNATIGTAIKPNRPIKIFIGFDVGGQEVIIPIMEALSTQPQEDKAQRTLTINANDFVTYLDNIPQETQIFIRQRTDNIIASILAAAGIGSSNYTLDQGINTPGFVGFGQGDYIGQSIQNLAQAEEGLFYQDELGQFRYVNRYRFSKAPYTVVQWIIEPKDIINWQVAQSSQIINHMTVSGNPRSVKGETQVWNDGQEEVIPPGQSITVWAQFQDPVTTLASLEAGLDYQAFDASNGAGSDITGSIGIVLTSFTTTAMMVITNNNANTAYLHKLSLRGNPATQDYAITETYEDTASVDEYSEQDQSLENDFIQSQTFAQNLAKQIVLRWKDPNDQLQLQIRGVPQLQLGDRVSVHDPDTNIYTDYRLVGIQGVFEPGSFLQTLTLRKITANEIL